MVVGRGGNAAPLFVMQGGAPLLKDASPCALRATPSRRSSRSESAPRCLPFDRFAASRRSAWSLLFQARRYPEMTTGEGELLCELALNPYTFHRPMALGTQKFAHIVAMAIAVLAWPALTTA